MSSPTPPPGYNDQGNPYNKIMVAAIIIVFFVVFFLFSVHMYVRWFWTRSSSYTISNRSPHRLNFLDPEVNSAAAHNIGLDKAAIDQLPTFIYKEPKTEQGLALLECAVCLSEFQENEKGRLLPACKHSFHTDCIDMWFYSHSTCPLCRTAVTPTPSSSTIEQQHQQEEELQQEEGNAMEAPPPTYNDPPLRTAHEGISIYSTIYHGNDMQYPSNVLFWGNQTQVTSQLSFSQGSEKPSSSTTTKSIPQITVEIPTRQDTSASDQACSPQPMKSPGLRLSIKRMLSRQSSKGNRVFGFNEEGVDSPKDTTTLPV